MVQHGWLHLWCDQIHSHPNKNNGDWSHANFFAFKQDLPNFQRPRIFTLPGRVWHHLWSLVLRWDWQDKDWNDGGDRLQHLNFPINDSFRWIQSSFANLEERGTHAWIYDLVFFSHRHHFWKLCDFEQYQRCDLLLQRNRQLLLHMERPGCHQLLLYYPMRCQLGRLTNLFQPNAGCIVLHQQLKAIQLPSSLDWRWVVVLHSQAQSELWKLQSINYGDQVYSISWRGHSCYIRPFRGQIFYSSIALLHKDR